MCDVLSSAMLAADAATAPAGTDVDPTRPMEQAPNYYGGQAVIEGVMMRGADNWAVAVRRPDETIWLEQHPVADFSNRKGWIKRPIIRGMFALVDSLKIGLRALNISAEQSMIDPEADEAEHAEPDAAATIATGLGMALGLAFFVGLFILIPTSGVGLLDRFAFDGNLGDGFLFHTISSTFRITVFLLYIVAISLMKDIRRVFEYHGAEHKTISAWELGSKLAPDHVHPHRKEHVRCGTNFLVLVMIVATFVYTIAGLIVVPPEGAGLGVRIAYHAGLRILLLPVVAGVAFEFLRLGAAHYDNVFVRGLMQPGLWLQKITTRVPDTDQIEVALRAFEAVVPDDALGDRVDQDALPSTVIGPTPEADAADETEAVVHGD